MLGAIANVVSSVLPGPVGGIVGGILGGLTGGGAAGGIGQALGGLLQPGGLMQGIQSAFQSLFGGAKPPGGAPPVPQLPMPFSPGGGMPGLSQILQNPLGALQGLGSQFGQIASQLGGILGGLTGPKPGGEVDPAFRYDRGGGSAPPASGGSTGGLGNTSNIDSMMDQANQLASSDKPSDQLKAQQLMQKAMRMFEQLSKLMENQSQMQGKAIQAMR